VNCAGAWADEVRHKDDPNLPKKLCHVGGSHITYDERVASSKYGLTMPSKDGRVTLVVPWMGRVIAGTTEKKFD
jgi:glycerol-3-phosphate dehydrogenase